MDWARQNTTPLKFNKKLLDAAFLAVFSNSDKWKLEIAGDIISGVAVDWVGADACIKYSDSWSNHSRDTQAIHFLIDDEQKNDDAGRRKSWYKAKSCTILP